MSWQFLQTSGLQPACSTDKGAQNLNTASPCLILILGTHSKPFPGSGCIIKFKYKSEMYLGRRPFSALYPSINVFKSILCRCSDLRCGMLHRLGVSEDSGAAFWMNWIIGWLHVQTKKFLFHEQKMMRNNQTSIRPSYPMLHFAWRSTAENDLYNGDNDLQFQEILCG